MAVKKTVKKEYKYGMEGKEILDFQKLLKAAGSTINPNGKYTIGMVSAVKCFQKKNKLAVTGVIDEKTAAKLEELKKPAKKTAAKKAAK